MTRTAVAEPMSVRRPRSVLVTGSSGFIGLPVAMALAREGAAVLGVDLRPAERPLTGCAFVLGDHGDAGLIERLFRSRTIDTVIHAGGVSGPMLSRDAPFTICQANVVGTIQLLEAARTSGVERFVHLGSAAAFGDTPPAPVPDDAPLAATGLYGASKGAADLLLRAYRHDYGLDAVSLRISNAYGPRRRTRCAVRTMLADAIAGRPTHLDWGAGYSRSYLYLDDAVDAVLAAGRAERLPRWSYNVAGSEFPTMEEVAALIGQEVPGASITMAAGVDTLGYRREALDIGAAARDLGWAPRFTLARGLRAYAEWLRENPDEAA